ncbi:hypothetical protein [Paludifilum halophilum]|uniref:Pilus assembly protein TadE n=1 Tax=Paludifilum halophilum TaxID=1642702 RepID=A0A235B1Y8_9BACL|nr:hypothetical protein [Paludifilum halophilum]OYD06320.1 hypothetical protein CHM34_16515 [Paludifilum halophilum]
MKTMKNTGFSRLFREKKGGITVEFVAILPLILLIALFTWQIAVSGMAIMETENILRDEARYAATTGKLKQAEQSGKDSFESTDYYHLESFQVKKEKKENRITASAVTQIQLVFLPSQAFNYESEKKTVIIH